ncbi:hypothetical protein EIM48_03170 [Pseudoxanthomonas sp. SGNA-20]|nr:hypothetical protein EIM48_03170 [Pseudoxanthomonas sp. SGNA-20]RRN81061.1 hypothetical protein EIM50_04435 [Pseudoxanthomonas sp. SGD-10]
MPLGAQRTRGTRDDPPVAALTMGPSPSGSGAASRPRHRTRRGRCAAPRAPRAAPRGTCHVATRGKRRRAANAARPFASDAGLSAAA